MSRMLASVNCLSEALIARQHHVDIIDLKQPALGALGALDYASVTEIVDQLAREQVISATIGDLPMQTDIIIDAVQRMAATGVDYIKIGFFPGQSWTAVLNALAPMTEASPHLIAVLFADQQPDLDAIARFAQAGFRGIMLDTMDKQRGSLTEVMPAASLQQFVTRAKQYQLLSGLAGSLRLSDIAALLPLKADYLGFRGALCAQQQRTQALDTQALITIQQALQRTPT